MGNISDEDFNAANYWLVNSSLALTYGITENFDITVAPGLYQDTHSKNEYNLPDDIRLFLKAGSFDFAQRQLYFAGQLGFKFPVGEDHIIESWHGGNVMVESRRLHKSCEHYIGVEIVDIEL